MTATTPKGSAGAGAGARSSDQLAGQGDVVGSGESTPSAELAGELAGELAALEDERDFLLRSLADLRAEHAAGDLDDDDYATLEDDYTARAAAVLRAIERLHEPSRRRRVPRRVLM